MGVPNGTGAVVEYPATPAMQKGSNMSLKLKALGLGLLAVLATSAFAMNASATGGGHFVSESAHTNIVGTESGATHRLHLTAVGSEGLIGCSTATYSGTATTATVSQLDITPSYAGCTTTGTATAVTVTPNGCIYRFTTEVGGTNGTAHLICPAGKSLEIHHPNCTITVPGAPLNQNIPGVHYTRVTENGKHAITLDVNVSFTTEYHGGICIFLGTHHEGKLNGSVTVIGKDKTTGNPTGITAT